MATKIEWTECLAMPAFVASTAHRLNRQPVRSIVSEVMVILRSLLPAVDAALAFLWCESSVNDCMVNRHSGLFFGVCGRIKFLFPGARSSARKALGCQAVVSRSVPSEQRNQLPRVTAPAEFLSTLNLVFVFVNGQAGSFCRNLHNADFASHRKHSKFNGQLGPINHKGWME